MRDRRARVAVAEMPRCAIHILRLRRPPPALLRGVGEAIGLPLPLQPNSAVGHAPRLFWLAPDEWMIRDGADSAEAIAHAMAGATGHLAAVTHGRAVFRITGDARYDLMAKGTSLDLHPRVFGVGRSARTLFAQINVLIDAPPSAEAFDLYADVSYADHLRRWFADAVVEFEREPS